MPAPVTDAATDRLRGLIISGQVHPGDRLPAEAVLSAQMGVSRGSLREAVRVLVDSGVLDVRRGDGTYVTALTPELLLSGLGTAVQMMRDTSMLKLIETRRVLEPAVTALAAQRASDEEVRQINLHLTMMRQSHDLDELVKHDADFHHAVSTSSGNTVLSSILNGISDVTTLTRVWRGLIDKDARDRTIAEHSAIASAISAHDSLLAEAAALLHVCSIESWIRETVATNKMATGTKTGPKSEEIYRDLVLNKLQAKS